MDVAIWPADAHMSFVMFAAKNMGIAIAKYNIQITTDRIVAIKTIKIIWVMFLKLYLTAAMKL